MILVVGGSDVDAGKTTFATGLVARTGAVGFKPRAGNDRWFHHDDYRRAVEDGRLYGSDARRLAAASPGGLAPETVNPVHRLWEPTPGHTGLLGRDGRRFLLDRAGDRFVVNGAADLPERVREGLPVTDAVTVGSVTELNRATERLHLPALEALAERVRAADRAVVESYSDVARPLRGLDPGAVAVVDPGRVRVFDGDRFRRACEVAGGTPGTAATGQLEERVGDVLDLLDAEAVRGLPALGPEARADPERVADAYRGAYEATLEVAGW